MIGRNYRERGLGETPHYIWLNQRGFNTSYLDKTQLEKLYQATVASGGTLLPNPANIGNYAYNPAALPAIQALGPNYLGTATQAQLVTPKAPTYSPTNPPPGMMHDPTGGGYVPGNAVVREVINPTPQALNLYQGPSPQVPTPPKSGTTDAQKANSNKTNTTNTGVVIPNSLDEFLSGMKEWLTPSTAISNITDMSSFGAREIGLVAIPAIVAMGIFMFMQRGRRGQ